MQYSTLQYNTMYKLMDVTEFYYSLVLKILSNFITFGLLVYVRGLSVK
jgi:hypothetical protein